MRYFCDALDHGLGHLFHRPPSDFSKTDSRDLLRRAVGGLLYIPASHQGIAGTILSNKIPWLTSMAVCLEDSVGDGKRRAGMENARGQLGRLARALAGGSLPESRLPLLFVRVKDNGMLEELADFFAENSRLLTGVILPKVTPHSLRRGLELTDQIARRAAHPFYAMPIFESEELAASRDRLGLLHEMKDIADGWSHRVLNIRVGATDLSGLYGIRRRADTPLYSIPVVADIIGDVVRVFGLRDQYTVSGPVWEYYTPAERARAENRWEEIRGLLRETALDLQNGILGKTCVHPAQLPLVQAACTVSYEEYRDALEILEGDLDAAGVLASGEKNKMNELRPHALWAKKTADRGRIYGVRREQVDEKELLEALLGGEMMI